MKIKHSDAIVLEGIVRRVHFCERAGMGGYIDADHFENQPFDAALIALAPLWKKADAHEIEDFLLSWEDKLRNGGTADINLYITELEDLVTKLMEDLE